MAVVNLRSATVTITDGTGSQTVKVGDGSLTFTESRAIEYMTDRGILDEVKLGPPEPVSVDIDCAWLAVGVDYVEHSAGFPSVATTKQNAPSYRSLFKGDGRLSIDPDTERPYACDLKISYPDSSAASGTRTVLFPAFRAETGSFDLSASTMKVSGKAFARRAQMLE